MHFALSLLFPFPSSTSFKHPLYSPPPPPPFFYLFPFTLFHLPLIPFICYSSVPPSFFFLLPRFFPHSLHLSSLPCLLFFSFLSCFTSVLVSVLFFSFSSTFYEYSTNMTTLLSMTLELSFCQNPPQSSNNFWVPLFLFFFPIVFGSKLFCKGASILGQYISLSNYS